MDKQVELVLAEAKRRRSQALLDSSRRLEHLEVAEALEAAAKMLERSMLCSSETKSSLSPQHLGLKKRGLSPEKNPIPRQVTGRVVYIHPKGRYFTLEAVVHGHTIRESFKRKEDIEK